jgi:hypothetical protein
MIIEVRCPNLLTGYVRVVVPRPNATGHIAGPHRPGHTTIELTYPLRTTATTDSTTLEAIIPEPNLAPFSYRLHIVGEPVREIEFRG